VWKVEFSHELAILINALPDRKKEYDGREYATTKALYAKPESPCRGSGLDDRGCGDIGYYH